MAMTFQDFAPQGSMIASLQRQVAEGTLPHALLLCGEKGMGKKTLAQLIASALLCTGDGEKPCGLCEDCRLVAENGHPDLVLVRRGVPLAPDGKAGRASIPVEDIRELIRICGENPSRDGKRAVLIFDAESMTDQAQNALLRTLEEPPTETHFILVTEKKESILTTIRSRCRMLALHPWEDRFLLQLLAHQGVEKKRAEEAVLDAGGSIGAALDLAVNEEYWKRKEEIMAAFFGTESRSEILRISASWKDRKAEAEELFSVLEGETERMLRARFRQSRAADSLSRFPVRWQRFARRAEPARFSFLLDEIGRSRKLTGANVNFQAVTEQLLMAFIGEGNQWQK